jgi:hypothetical protein
MDCFFHLANQTIPRERAYGRGDRRIVAPQADAVIADCETLLLGFAGLETFLESHHIRRIGKRGGGDKVHFLICSSDTRG